MTPRDVTPPEPPESASRTATGSDPVPDRVDVVVVGGGIAGLSTAYHLATAGVSVAVLEKSTVGSGTTARAVGALMPPMRQPFHETVHFRGEQTAKKIWEFAGRSCQGLAELLIARGVRGVDLSGGYVLAERDTLDNVHRSYSALEAAGLPVEWVTAERVAEVTGGRGFTGGYWIAGGGSLDPRRSVEALGVAAKEAGATIVEGARVDNVRSEAEHLLCESARGSTRCEMVVYACHIASRRFSPFLADEIVPVRGQALATAPVDLPPVASAVTHWRHNLWRRTEEGGLVLSGWRHDSWDRGYYRTRPELDTALHDDLVGWFELAFPRAAPLDVRNKWSGIYGWSADHLPLVGPLPGRMGELVISGFSGGGLSFAFESGRLIAHTVTGRDPVPGTELLNPRRFS